MIKSILIIFLGFITFSIGLSQGPCGVFTQSSRTAEVTISQFANLNYDGLALPIGARLVAIDEDGNCASEFLTWMGSDTMMIVNGEDTSVEGFKDGELISFLIAVNDSCFVKTGTVIYDTSMSTDAGNFEEDESFDLIFLNGQNEFNAAAVDVIESRCDSMNGSFSIEVANGFGPFSFQWSHDSLLMDSIAVGLASGNYEIMVQDLYGCPLVIENELISDPLPIEFEFLIDSTQSTCDSLILSNNITCFNCNYLWSNGVITEFNQVNSPGIYTVFVTNGECTANDTLEVIFSDPPNLIASISDDEICIGDTIQLNASGAVNYLWESNAEIINATDSTAFAVILEDSSFDLVADNFCKSDSAFFAVTVFEQPEAGESLCVALNNNSIQLNASGADSYQWEPNNLGPVSDENIADPTASPTASTVYYVNFIDSNGCESRDSVEVEVIEDIIAATPLYNIITPNNDGKNDVLFFDKLEIATESELIVFNRWGKVVHQEQNYKNDWGGLSNGDLLPAGSYHYILNINGTQLKSNLTIVYE